MKPLFMSKTGGWCGSVTSSHPAGCEMGVRGAPVSICSSHIPVSHDLPSNDVATDFTWALLIINHVHCTWTLGFLIIWWPCHGKNNHIAKGKFLYWFFYVWIMRTEELMWVKWEVKYRESHVLGLLCVIFWCRLSLEVSLVHWKWHLGGPCSSFLSFSPPLPLLQLFLDLDAISSPFLFLTELAGAPYPW